MFQGASPWNSFIPAAFPEFLKEFGVNRGTPEYLAVTFRVPSIGLSNPATDKSKMTFEHLSNRNGPHDAGTTKNREGRVFPMTDDLRRC
jgi:hypothetical protein